MAVKAVQQFMLGTVMNNEAQARDTMQKMKAAGIAVGKGGRLDWKGLVKDSGLQVVSLHTDLGSVERNPAAVAAEAKDFGTKYAVITGMYGFA